MEGPPTPANDQQETTQRPQMNRSSLYMLLFLFSLLFFNFSDDGTVRNGKPTKADLLEELQLEKEILNNLTFGVNVSHVNYIEKYDLILLSCLTYFLHFL